MLKRMVTLCCVLLLAGPAWGVTAEELIGQLNTTTGQKQFEAAVRLGSFRFPEVVSALAARLDDKHTDVTVRAACATSLGKLNDPSSYAQIVVRRTIEDTLGTMTDKQRVSVAVTTALEDETAAPSAIRVLGKVGGPGVIAPLAKQLDSPKASIRQAVIEALGNIYHPDVVPYLIKYYPKANDAEKGLILSALGNHPHADAMRLLIDELMNTKAYPALRRRAAHALGKLHAQHTIPVLVKVMLNTAEHTGLRLACVKALGNFSDRDDAAIAGLIGALSDRRLAETAALELNRITKRFFGTDKQKWEDWFEKFRTQRDRRQRIGH